MAGSEWFRHSDEEALPQSEHGDHVSPKALGVTLILIVFGILAVVLLLSAYFGSYYKNLRAERMEGVDAVSEQYLLYKSNAQARLAGTGWVSRSEGTVHVPIETAMESVLEFYSQPGVQADNTWRRPTAPVRTRTNNPQGAVASNEVVTETPSDN